jgi:putative MATE family efflux protein
MSSSMDPGGIERAPVVSPGAVVGISPGSAAAVSPGAASAVSPGAAGAVSDTASSAAQATSADAALPGGAGIRQALRLALAGAELDYTRLPIGRAVLLLAVPMMLEMAMESVFAVCDVFFVSRLGIQAVATVGLTEAVITLVYAAAVGLSMATTAMVARRIGEGNRRAAGVAAIQAILLGLGVALLFALPGVRHASGLLRLMGGSADLVAHGSGYTAVLLGGSVTILLLFLMNAVFRGAGDAALAMRALWLANGINLVLDPCLIFGLGSFPELGLTGAAVATTIGRGCGVIYQLIALSRGRGRVRLEPGVLRLEAPVLLRLARVSVGGIGQYLISTSSWILLVRIISSFGDAAVAGYTIALRIVMFTILPAWGIANAAATLMGQNLGAGRPDRAAAAVWRTAWYNTGFLMIVAVLFVTGAELLVKLFQGEGDVLAHGVSCLRLVSYGYLTYGLGMVMTQAFNGAGDTTTPTVINFACYWLVLLPLAWLLSRHTELGVNGAFAAVPLADAVLAVVGILVFRRGAWRTRRI